jgi:hypothetical protein
LNKLLIFQKKQQQKLSSLYISPNEWSLLSTLTTLLKPFYEATMQLQTQTYATLSLSKIIEKSLLEFFSVKASYENENTNEKLISSALYDKLKHYLVDNIALLQKKSTLVSSMYFLNST